MISSKENKSKVSAIIRACRLIMKMNRRNPAARQSDVKYYQMLEKYYTRLLDAREEGRFTAAHTVFFPTEILYAMDIVPMHTEMTTWMTSLFTAESAEILSAGAEMGLASEICSPHRGIAGAFAIGAVPRPDVILWSNMICDNTAKSGEMLMKLNNCPGFFLDHPFQQTEDEVNYFIGELQGMISFLEQESGQKMDWDKLAEIVGRMDHQIQLFREINELRKAVPTPFSPQGFLQLLTTDYLFPGQPEAIEYLETLRQELAEMVEAGKGAVTHERFRLMSLFVPPMYLMAFLENISQEYGVVSVTEPFFTYWGEGRLDPAKPLNSIVKKSYMIPEVRSMYGPIDEQTINTVVNIAKQYQVNGVIYYADTGCRQSCAAIRLFKDVLNGIGLPVLTLDCDIVDPTFTSQAEIREKMERFFELLTTRSHQTVTEVSTRMKTVGIDAGSLVTKAVVLDGNNVQASSIIPSGDDSESSAKAAMEDALSRAKLSLDGDWRIFTTGAGATSVSFSQQQKPITTCLAQGIYYLLPSVRMVIDIGAESSTVIKMNKHGDVSDWATHDKCASGTGIFLQQIAKLMQMSLEEMAGLSFYAKAKADISNTCAVFAESEVISHVHREPPTPKEDIIAGIYLSTVRRIIALCKRLGIERDVAVVGGVALNSGLVKILEEEMGFEVLVPDMPQAVGALGAAIIARGNMNSEIT
ncbi:2-hydroxyacyl-CoA dehydratase [Chloroflexota bacterium]